MTLLERLHPELRRPCRTTGCERAAHTNSPYCVACIDQIARDAFRPADSRPLWLQLGRFNRDLTRTP